MSGNETKASRAKAQPADAKAARKKMPRWAKVTLRVLRTVLIPVLCAAALICGLVVGYVYIGGRGSADVWQWDTWKHLFDLVFAN